VRGRSNIDRGLRSRDIRRKCGRNKRKDVDKHLRESLVSFKANSKANRRCDNLSSNRRDSSRTGSNGSVPRNGNTKKIQGVNNFVNHLRI